MNIFNSIKSRISILQVVSDYTTLKRAGAYWKGTCPFHHEKTPSFTVTPHKEIFYCFGCHHGGDVIAFIAQAENCSQLEAVRYIAETYNLELPEEAGTWQSHENQAEEKRRYHQLHELTASWCMMQVQKNSNVRSYLAHRNISEEVQKKFRIGYFPSGQAALKPLLQMMKEENFLARDLIATKIALEGKQGIYSPFEDRIIFPINDHMGNTCGFGGRIFQSQDLRAKYYNSHDHTFFNKGSLLFGLDLAKKQIQAKNGIFLVEGYTDCVAMVQAGFTNTIATLGTACSLEHLNTLSRYANSLFIVYDGDIAGKKAIVRLNELCWSANIELFIVTLPEQEDPASYLGKGEDLNPLINQAKDIFSWCLDHMHTRLTQSTTVERIAAVKELVTMIAKIDDPVKREVLIQRAAHACSLPIQTLQKELLRSAPATVSQPEPPATPATSAAKSPKKNFILEKQIFCLILNNNEHISEEDEKFLAQALPEPLVPIFQQLQSFKRAVPHGEFSTFFNMLAKNEQEIVNKLLMQSTPQANHQLFSQLLDQLRKKQWKIMVNDVKIKLAHAQRTNDIEGMQKIVAEFQSLKQKMLEKGLL